MGLTLGEADALIDPRVRAKSGDPWVEEASEERDARTLHALGTWTMRHVSPVVALAPPGGLFVDVAGTERLFGEESDLCRGLLRGMHRFGLGVRIGVADGIGAAWAVARFGRTPRTIVESGGEEDALAELPVAALRLPEATVDGLAELGVVRVSQLVALDRGRVAARFGGDVALRLDQALGRAFEPVTPLVYETPPQSERTFEGPVRSAEAIRRTAEDLVHELCEDLERARRGVLEAILVVMPSDLPPRRIPIALARASANPRHLWTMLEPKVESVHMGFGIEGVRFTAVRTARLPTRQVAAWGSGETDARSTLDRHAGELVDTLGARLGTDRVVVPAPEATHLPEHAYSWRRPGEAREENPRGSVPAHAKPPRPSRLFHPPEPATFDAVDERGAPKRIRWRGIAYRIRRARGPERIARPWWDDAEHTLRDYYRLETACGRTLWSYTEPKYRRSFIHGEWS